MRFSEQMAGVLRFAREHRACMVAARVMAREKVQKDELSEEELSELVAVFEEWEVGAEYQPGDLLRYDGALYEVIQGHISQLDWAPDMTASLFVEKTAGLVVLEWVQPSGAHDSYGLGDVVWHNGERWVSAVGDNVWQPGVYGWEVEG